MKIPRIKLSVFRPIFLGLTLLFFWFVDDHRLNLSYVLWKYHCNPCGLKNFQYFNLDNSFRQSLIGKAKEDLIRYFPDAYLVTEKDPGMKYYFQFMKTNNVLKLGRSRWVAELSEEDKVIKFSFLKG